MRLSESRADYHGALSVSVTKRCCHCGSPFNVRPSHAHARVHCSRKCMAETYRGSLQGTANPNARPHTHRECSWCGNTHTVYNKERRARRVFFCSWHCFNESGTASTNARANGKKNFRGGCKDLNQGEIVLALTAAGASVLDATNAGLGFPDLIVGHVGRTLLLEVKNPKTYYGRQGFNERQQHFVENWKGGPVAIVETVEDALRAIEIKDGGKPPSERKLSESEAYFLANWKGGPAVVVKDEHEAIAAVLKP